MHDHDNDTPLDGTLRQAVDAVRGERLVTEAVDRSIERARQIPAMRRFPKQRIAHLALFAALAATLALIVTSTVLIYQNQEPSGEFKSVASVSSGERQRLHGLRPEIEDLDISLSPDASSSHTSGTVADPAMPKPTGGFAGGMGGTGTGMGGMMGGGGGISGRSGTSRDHTRLGRGPLPTSTDRPVSKTEATPSLATITPAPAPAPPLAAEPAPLPSKPAPPKAVKRPAPNQQQAGLLTAGSFDDNLHPEVFDAFLKKLDGHHSLGGFIDQMKKHRLVITVKNADGQPIGNARVRVFDAGQKAVELRTRSDGSAVLLAAWDKLALDGDLTVAVTTPDGTEAQQKLPKFAKRCEVLVQQAKPRAIKNLDLALVIDTTGSMGDELEYLKKEIDGIVTAVKARFPEVNQRYALILYRDTGDEYVVRKFDFMPKLADFQKRLGEQSAAGGGDEPEAMHAALEEALKLEWREDADTARVAFLVADAPPHDQDMDRAFKALDRLRKQAIAVYPVACSGYNQECELVMRAAALLTGSRFLFLTDDSGVGNAHAEPNISHYHVEKLNQLMIRMIAGELAGQRIAVKPEQILRSVGKPDEFDRAAEKKSDE